MDSLTVNLGLHFENIAKLYPLAIAIQAINGESITYQQLNARANQIANYFKKTGVAQQEVIAIFNNKTVDDFASMLACLKIGAIYTNLDPMNPPERLLKILEICQPKLILFNSDNSCPLLNKIGYASQWTDCHADFSAEIENENSENLADTLQISRQSSAYIMFTSGSTGFPKGAVMSHDNVLRFVKWTKHRFALTPDDRLANANPVYFDNSVFDFYASLFNGASLVPIPSTMLKKPKEILNVINQMRCTIWFSVPSLLIYFLNLRILHADDFKNVRKIIFGGEGFPKPKLKELVDRYSHRITFTNVYGPTECTCICSSYDLQEKDLDNLDGILPLGEINADFDYLILDEFGEKVKPGMTGELCLRGPCVGKGYYNNTELTAKAFNEAMYYTGDLVYEDTHTKLLHFVARKDNQIKLQGYRIELNEIEAAIYNLSYIDEVAVIHFKTDDLAGKIMAAVVLNMEKSETDIINDVRKFLPEYMIPRKVIFKECLPKNQNGKVDRLLIANECQQL